MTRQFRKFLQAASLVVSTIVAETTFAQESTREEVSIAKQQQRAQNPFSDIQGAQFEYFNIRNQDGFGNNESNISTVRYFSSFKINEGDYIARVIVPYAYDLAFGGSGVGDTTIAVGRIYNRDWGVFGVGGQVVLPTGDDDLTNDGYRVGPLVGAIYIKDGLQLGAINFNEFTVHQTSSNAPDVNVSQIQFLGSYHLGRGFSVGLSEMILEYDWEQNKFTDLPLGVGISQIIPGKRIINKFELQYEHDFQSGFGGDGDTLRFKYTVFKK